MCVYAYIYTCVCVCVCVCVLFCVVFLSWVGNGRVYFPHVHWLHITDGVC
ncbi:hypothetical protein MOQ_004686, partial [Trypanosoma cruzi marinkellei]